MGIADTTRRRTAARRERGSATTEFAIVISVFVPVLLFSVFLFDIMQLKLKVQEAARYTAFEFANHSLHDYRRAGSSRNAYSGMQSQAKTDVEQGSKFRYRFFNSSQGLLSDAMALAGGHDPRTRFGAKFEVPDVKVTLTQLPIVANPADMVEMKFPLSMLRGLINSAFNWLVGQIPVGVSATGAGILFSGGRDQPHMTGRGYGLAQPTLMQLRIGRALRDWGFPQEGEVQVTVSTRVENAIVPTGGPWKNGAYLKRKLAYNMKETYQIYVDTWRLPDGTGVKPGDAATGNPSYYAVVNNMTNSGSSALLSRSSLIGMLYLAGRSVALAGGVKPKNPASDPLTPSLASVPYTDQLGNTGKLQLNSDGASAWWNTSEFREEGNGQNPYDETRKKRGKYFMGCRDVAKIGCWSEAARR